MKKVIRNKKYWLKLIGFTTLALFAGVTFLTYRFAFLWGTSMVHPNRNPLTDDPSLYDHDNWEAVNFLTPDGLNISGWFMPPSPGNDAVIIYVHGHVANKFAYLPEAILLNQRGFGSLLIDLRGNGDSDGDLTTFGLLEARDIRGAVDYLLTRPEIDPEKIGIAGISMGGSTTLLAVPDIPEIKAVVVQSTYTSLEDNINEGLETMTGINFSLFNNLIVYYAEKEAEFSIDEVRPIDLIANISPRPILITHGDADTLLNVQNGYALFKAAQEPKELIIYPGLGHGRYYDFFGEDYINTLEDFFSKYLLGVDE